MLPVPIDFASNDSLGLAKHVESYEGMWGSTGSRVTTGNSSLAMRLEEIIARYHKRETALLFNSGFNANLGALTALAKEGDLILYDEQIHASTKLAISLSKAHSFPFRHNSLKHLKMRLERRASYKNCFIAIESLYSTDGSLAPLTEIDLLAKEESALLILDEAHAVGIYGKEGRGLGEEINPFIQLVTFGKALGSFGSAVLTTKEVKEKLISSSIPFIYTTALPEVLLLRIKSIYERLPSLDKEREKVKVLSLLTAGVLSASKTHIHLVKDEGRYERLTASKIAVGKLFPPTVRKHAPSLRISLHSFNTEAEINLLKEILQ